MNVFSTGSEFSTSFVDAAIGLVLLVKWTAVLVLAWLAHGLLARRNPRWRVALWRTALVGLALVAVLSGIPPIVTYPLVPRDRPMIVVAPTAPTAPGAVVGGDPEVDTDRAQAQIPWGHRPSGADPSQPRSDWTAGGAGVAAGKAAKPPGVLVQVGRNDSSFGESRGFRWRTEIVPALWTVWLVGVLVLIARLIAGSVGLARLIRSSSDVSGAIVRECREIAARLECRGPIRVRSMKDVATPCLAGLWRPVLLLPERECDDVRPDDLRVILAHELAHARNHDVAWNLAAHLASILLWFHPLAWRIRAAHASACDAVCDAVAADLVGDVSLYGRTLARMAVRMAGPAPVHGLAMARTSDVRRRIDALNRMVFRKPLSWRSVMPAVFVSSAFLVLIGGLGFTRAEPPGQRISQAEPAKAGNAAKPASDKASERLTLRAVSAETNEPIEGVSIEYTARIGDGKFLEATIMTGDDGTTAIEWPAGATIHKLWITARAPKLVPIHILWDDERHPIKLPVEKELRFEPGTTIGGIVKDEAGQPIAGATVEVHAPPTEYEGRNYVFRLGSLTTDALGRWRLDVAPKNLADVGTWVEHPRYKRNGGPASRALDHVTILKKGLTVTGRVIDATGRPVRGAKVIIGSDTWGTNSPTGTSNEQGTFTLENCDPGSSIITVQAEGFAPRLQDNRIDERTAPVEFRLTEPGSVLRLRFVDVQGKPVAGVTFGPDTWRGHRSIHFRGETGPDGRVEWRSAPKDVMLCYAGKADYMWIRHLPLTASDREQTIILHPKLVIAGRVTDAKTGRAVSRFRLVKGCQFQWQNQIHWFENEGVDITNGQYTVQFDEPRKGLLVRIEAPGYKPVESRSYRPDEGSQTFDVVLEPAAGLSGVVLRHDGKPAPGVEVGLSTGRNDLRLRSGHFDQMADFPKTSTGSDGQFWFPARADRFQLIALSDAGYAEASSEEFAKSRKLVLQPWGGIEGGVRIGARLGVNQEVMYHPDRPSRRVGLGSFDYVYRTWTDERGRFQFDRVVPGSGIVVRVVRDNPNPRGAFAMLRCWPERVEVKPGQTAQVTIGGKGRPVIGRVVLDGTPEAPVDWTVNLPVILGGPSEKLDRKQFGRLYFAPSLFAAHLDKDGRFRVEDVPAGTYELELPVNGPADPRFVGAGREIGQLKMSITVPEIPGGRSNEPLDLGTITAKLFDMIKIGDLAPDFDVERIGTPEKGGRLKLSDYRGKLVLLDFWDVRDRPIDRIVLKEVQQTFGGDPRFVLIGLTCGKDAAEAEKVIKQNGLNWMHGFAGDFDSGISARYKIKAIPHAQILGPDQKFRRIPLTFLIGPDGRILGHDLSGGDLEAVRKALEDPKLFPAAARVN
jgi:beta-lactamase regulating signal transducer with metallopeptidase domain/peroxiredoxin